MLTNQLVAGPAPRWEEKPAVGIHHAEHHIPEDRDELVAELAQRVVQLH